MRASRSSSQATPLSSSDPSDDRSFEGVPLRGYYDRDRDPPDSAVADCEVVPLRGWGAGSIDLLIRLTARWRFTRAYHCVGGVLCPR